MSSILYSGPFERVSSTLSFAISVSFADADLDTPIENLYPFKHIKWLEAVSNQYIPSILAILGAVLGCVAVGAVSLESIVYGAVTGLASTGLHQVFSQIINKTE